MPVDLRPKDWGAQVAAACEATYMFLSGGTSLSIRRAAALANAGSISVV